MPIPTPFHSRTAPLCESWEWRDWAGYLAPTLYEPISHEREYFAIRNSAALIDVSPLFKYEISGPDALKLVDRIMTRDITRCTVGQVMYTPWCDALGKVIDDGTVSRLSENHFLVTSAHANLRWFRAMGEELDAQVIDVSQSTAALSIQGPKSRAILQETITDIDFDSLPYFHLAHGTFAGQPITVSRTGYTGDLGYELWLRPLLAEPLWDHLMSVGANYNILPAGIAALDLARIEAGLLLIEVDYISARDALIEVQKSSPYEIGLGWAVKLKGDDFIGKAALQDEYKSDSNWAFVGLEVGWFELERLYGDLNLRPNVAGKRASRTPVPIYSNGRQVGQATSHCFSPLLKKYIAIGTVEPAFVRPDSQIDLELTVEYSRQMAQATVVKTPFFDPPRKRNNL